MKRKQNPSSAAERYDCVLLNAHDVHLPAGYQKPQFTRFWPAENVALLERYREWLLGGGSSHDVVDHLYIPMAGHALGLNLKPHPAIDIAADLEPALNYVKAKRLSTQWIDMCRNALNRFRRFLRQQRGQIDIVFRPLNLDCYYAGLPAWLIEQLKGYQRLMQRNWRPARLNERITRFWSGHAHLWRWLLAHYSISQLTDVKRQHILDYVEHCLSAGYSVRTVNQTLRNFHAFLLYLQSHEFPVPQALLRIPSLKEPDSLPRFLTDEQVRRLRDDFEQRVAVARYAVPCRESLFDRAVFYLLWQGGMRLGEVEELRLEDLDLAGRKLMVRQGKGLKDRTIYLTSTVVEALQRYLSVRGMGPTSHVFLYRNDPVRKELIWSRIKAAGERVGVKVSPHRLRHTCATQLLNAGCRVTSIQKLLGHRRLNSTMIYARVHDQTVADDYYTAMADIENRLQLAEKAAPVAVEPNYLLSLIDALVTESLEGRKSQVIHELREGILALSNQF